ncbi:hypothetical protein [Kitasatospora cineracea]|uniref:Aspartyl/asparaginyl beta-hydroxylase n=1 Tax=Kitasatospora cineracea TaxID=88074 RepID=A0A8G1U9F7_9ACTN|nr:hypothetical protein [Kitasatospora cineracea]ROR35302.1 hypothetical protein EDD39_6959 [Kitasatospora cineracea]
MTTVTEPQSLGQDMLELVPGLQFDHQEILRAYQQVVDRVPVTDPEHPEHRLRRLGLTHRAGAADPWHDAGTGQFDQKTGEKHFEESEFAFFNEELKDTYFHHLYQSLPFRIGRMRLVPLHPGEIYHMHTDASRVAHVAIVSNEDSRLLFRTGHTYHVPTDGRVHLLNTRLHHSAYNAGGTTRIHLTMTKVE